MATIVLTDAVVNVNAVNLSDHVRQVTLNLPVADLLETAMGATTATHRSGLIDWSIEVEFYQDYAAGKVDATLFPLIGAAAFTIFVQAVSGAESATNPKYTGSAILLDYQPVAGQVGAMAMTKATFKCAGALTRDVTP